MPLVCSNRAATRVENIRTQQKTAQPSYPGFALNKQTSGEVRKHEKTLRGLHTAEVAGSLGHRPLWKSNVLQDKRVRRRGVGSKHRPFVHQ